MDMRYVDKKFLTDFIKLYQSFPCLWKVKSKAYTNKRQKEKAYEEMVNFCKRLFPDANRNWVAKKIQNFRGPFRKELRKVKEKAAVNVLYSPQLWYFQHLLFLKDQDADAKFLFEDVGEESGSSAEEETEEPQKDEGRQDEDITNLRQQDRDFLTEFIDLYRSLPCLWKVKSKEYSNRQMKTKAYNTLIKKFRQVDPKANRDTVVKKINSLRSCHRKELRKIDDSLILGATEEDVHVPHLWYFDLLNFLRDQDQDVSSESMSIAEYEDEDSQVEPEADRDMVTKKINSLRSSHRKERKKIIDSERSGAGTEDVYKPTLWYYEMLQFVIDQDTPRSTISNFDVGSQEEKYVPVKLESAKRKASISEDHYLPLEFCSPPVDKVQLEKSNLDINEYEAVGVSVAKKLQRMDATQAIFAESLIHSVLRKGLLKSLTENTDLQDGSS